MYEATATMRMIATRNSIGFTAFRSFFFFSPILIYSLLHCFLLLLIAPYRSFNIEISSPQNTRCAAV